MKTRTEKVIDVAEWDKLVQKTYGRVYNFQQQDGCRGRGVFQFSAPAGGTWDHDRDIVSEVVNGPERGVSFAAWLKRDPKTPLADGSTDYSLDLWWERNFYPDIQMVANDLHAKGLLEAGEYTIDIDW